MDCHWLMLAGWHKKSLGKANQTQLLGQRKGLGIGRRKNGGLESRGVSTRKKQL